MKTLLLSILWVTHSLSAALPSTGESTEPDFKATPRIVINRDNAAKEGISPIEIGRQVQAYFEAHEKFTLEELKALGITTSDGRTVKLSQVARVEVTFRKASQVPPAEQAARGHAVRPLPK